MFYVKDKVRHKQTGDEYIVIDVVTTSNGEIEYMCRLWQKQTSLATVSCYSESELEFIASNAWEYLYYVGEGVHVKEYLPLGQGPAEPYAFMEIFAHPTPIIPEEPRFGRIKCARRNAMGICAYTVTFDDGDEGYVYERHIQKPNYSLF